MTGYENSAGQPAPAGAGSVERKADGAARLLPRVTFGLGAAVLAGVVAVSVPVAPAGATEAAAQQLVTTAGLDAAINGITPLSLTTCCGIHNYY
jgi:hypothetical protein